MLAQLDRLLAYAAWIIAALLALMLFVGPQVVAEDKAEKKAPATYAGSEGAEGQAVFQDNCGSCHTLSAADTNGQVGPNLDETQLDAADVESIVREGRGGMPAFDELPDAEVRAVAGFVEAAAGD